MRKTWGRIRIRIWIGFKNGESDPDLEEQFKSGRFRLRYFSINGYYKVNIYIFDQADFALFSLLNNLSVVHMYRHSRRFRLRAKL